MNKVLHYQLSLILCIIYPVSGLALRKQYYLFGQLLIISGILSCPGFNIYGFHVTDRILKYTTPIKYESR